MAPAAAQILRPAASGQRQPEPGCAMGFGRGENPHASRWDGLPVSLGRALNGGGPHHLQNHVGRALAGPPAANPQFLHRFAGILDLARSRVRISD